MDIIKSESAKKILARSYDGGHICYENAEAAVEVAEKEMRDKAIEVLSPVLGNWVHGGDADCIIAEFEDKLNNE